MIKDTNERLTITLSKAQVKWLKTNAKKLKMNTSNFVKFLIDKNIGHLLFKLPKEHQKLIFEIAKIPWLDFDKRNQTTISDKELEELLK